MGFTAAARTCTVTSPGPGAGRSRVTTDSTSGPPKAVATTAVVLWALAVVVMITRRPDEPRTFQARPAVRSVAAGRPDPGEDDAEQPLVLLQRGAAGHAHAPEELHQV